MADNIFTLNADDVSNQLKLEGPLTSDIKLEEGEKEIFVFENIRLMEPRSVHRGGGASIRVAKGIRLFGGEGKSHTELTEVDRGDFVLTNKRVVYLGSQRTVTIPLDKILSYEHYTDGIGIRRSDRKNMQVFVGTHKYKLIINNGEPTKISGKVLDKIYNFMLENMN